MPGSNPLADAVNLAVAVRVGQQTMTETITSASDPVTLIPAMSALTDLILSAGDEIAPGFAVKLLNYFTATL